MADPVPVLGHMVVDYPGEVVIRRPGGYHRLHLAWVARPDPEYPQPTETQFSQEEVPEAARVKFPVSCPLFIEWRWTR